VNRGQVTAYGPLQTLLKPEVRRTELELEGVTDALEAELVALGAKHGATHGDVKHFVVEGEDARGAVVAKAVAGGAKIHALSEHRETLEDLFVRDALKDHREA
jgi:hypothetical protein